MWRWAEKPPLPRRLSWEDGFFVGGGCVADGVMCAIKTNDFNSNSPSSGGYIRGILSIVWHS